MPSRRILSNSNLAPIQEAAVNPYDSFNSDVINKLTRIVSGGKDIDVVVDGLDISSFSDRKWYAFTESLLPNISNSADWIVSKDSHNNNNAIIYYRTDAASEIDSGDIDFFIDHIDSYGTSYIETFVKDIPNSSVTKSIFEPLYGSTQSKDFEISFRLKWGTPKLIVVAIDETKIEIDHPKASDDLYTFRLTKYFRQKKIGEKLRFRFSVVLDAADPDSEMAKSSTNKTYVRIRDISCKLLGFTLPEPNRSIGPVEEIYNFNGINPTHSIRVTPGIALKDDVMLEELAKDINKDVSIDLPLTTGNNAVNSKIWIKNDPYTKSDFGSNYVYQLNNNLVEYKKFSASINSTTGRLVASVNGYNVYPSAQKELTYNTSGSIQDTLIGTAASAVLSENNKKLVVTFTKPSAAISNYNKNYGNHCLITYNDRVVDDVVININSSGVIAENIVATINTELVNDPHETNLKNKFKAYLALGPIKVSGDKLYYTPTSVKWAYVVLYYAYFKNPVPNVSYIGLVRESEIDNFREDYVILAKVRFIDPVTVDIISYENRQVKKLPHSDNINYSETCNDPEIWPQEVPVTVTDAINYLAKFDVDISRFVRYKHDYDAEISTAFNLVRKDAASLDTTPYININEDNHLERRIKINSNVIIVSELIGEFSYLSLPSKGTRFTKSGDYYTASGSSWAITNNQTIIKQNLKDLDEKFNVRTTYVMGIKNGDTFSPMFICFNNVGPFKFVNISDGEHAITFDWLYLGHSLLYPTAPFITTDNSGNWTDTDKGTINGSGTAQKYVDNETNGRYILSYDDVTVEGDTEGVPSGENHLNGQENHFKYLVFRSKSLNSSKFLRMLDILPKKSVAKNKSGSTVEESLIEGRILYGTNVATSFAGNQVHVESSQHYIDDNPIHGNLMIAEKASTRNTVAGKTTEVRSDNNSDTLISGHYSIPDHSSSTYPTTDSAVKTFQPINQNYNYGSKNGVTNSYNLKDNAFIIAKKRNNDTIDIISSKFTANAIGDTKILKSDINSDKLIEIQSTQYTISAVAEDPALDLDRLLITKKDSTHNSVDICSSDYSCHADGGNRILLTQDKGRSAQDGHNIKDIKSTNYTISADGGRKLISSTKTDNTHPTYDIHSLNYTISAGGHNNIVTALTNTTTNITDINNSNYTPGDFVGHWFSPIVEVRKVNADYSTNQIVIVIDTIHNFIIRTSEIISKLSGLVGSIPKIGSNNSTTSDSLANLFNTNLAYNNQKAFDCLVILDTAVANDITDQEYIDSNYYDYNASTGKYSKNGYEVKDLYCKNKFILVNDMNTVTKDGKTFRPYIHMRFDYSNKEFSHWTIGGKKYLRSKMMANTGELAYDTMYDENSGLVWYDIYRGYDNTLTTPENPSVHHTRMNLYPITFGDEGINKIALDIPEKAGSDDVTQFENSGNGYCRGSLIHLYARTKAEYEFMHIRSTPEIPAISGLPFTVQKTKKFIFASAKYYTMMKY